MKQSLLLIGLILFTIIGIAILSDGNENYSNIYSNSVDSLIICYDHEIVPGTVMRYCSQSAHDLLTRDDIHLLRISVSDKEVLNNIMIDIDAAEECDRGCIDTDVVALLHFEGSTDTLVLNSHPHFVCSLNSKFIKNSNLFMDIVEIIMENDTDWQKDMVQQLTICNEYYQQYGYPEELINRINSIIDKY